MEAVSDWERGRGDSGAGGLPDIIGPSSGLYTADMRVTADMRAVIREEPSRMRSKLPVASCTRFHIRLPFVSVSLIVPSEPLC